MPVYDLNRIQIVKIEITSENDIKQTKKVCKELENRYQSPSLLRVFSDNSEYVFVVVTV